MISEALLRDPLGSSPEADGLAEVGVGMEVWTLHENLLLTGHYLVLPLARFSWLNCCLYCGEKMPVIIELNWRKSMWERVRRLLQKPGGSTGTPLVQGGAFKAQIASARPKSESSLLPHLEHAAESSCEVSNSFIVTTPMAL